MAAGSADNNVRVYHMLDPEGPKRVLEVECHAERVDSISWAHRGVRFISGSKDGTALVWRFEYNQWRYVRISCGKATPG
jgi:bromodomain and WD repeat domain-containing protein 1/3